MLTRVWLYFKEMYPPIPSLTIAVVSFFNLYFMLQILQRALPLSPAALQVSWPSVAGALTLFFFLLFLRISDEFKDYEADKILFPERLVPSGRVFLSDLKGVMAVAIIAMWLLNLFVTQVPLAFGVLFGFGVLMYFYFFLKNYIAKSLILALLTHNPSVILMNFYVIAVFAHEYSTPIFTPQNFYLAALFWIPGLTWELSRKIRSPQEETEYETYSQVFGYRKAALIPMFALTAHYFMLLKLAVPLQLSWWFLGLLSLVLLGVLLMFSRFISNPTPKSSRLKPVTEAYMLVSAVGLLCDLGLKRGLVWLLT